MLDFVPSATGANLAALRALRAIRPLRLIQRVPALKMCTAVLLQVRSQRARESFMVVCWDFQAESRALKMCTAVHLQGCRVPGWGGGGVGGWGGAQALVRTRACQRAHTHT